MQIIIFFIVVLVLSTICILNILIQFSNSLLDKVLKYDYLQLFTYWTLYAPSPMKYDFYIMYRDQFKSGIAQDLTEIEFNNKNFVHYIIKSDLKKEMTLYKSCACMLRIEDKDKILKSYYFKYIENFVKEHNQNSDVVKRQFCIIKKERNYIAKPELFLISYINYE